MPVGQDGPPPSPEEAARAMARWPDDVSGLRSVWADIATEWGRTDERARSLGDEAAHRRIADEWSYVETVRHVVFVVDLWIRRAVLNESSTFRAEGLPPTFMPPAAFPGVDSALDVSLDRAIDLRHEAEGTVASVLAGLDDEGLTRSCGRAGEHTVLRCVKTVLNEADLHRQFAARDLATLEVVSMCRTCELVERRDRGEAPAWDQIVRTESWDLVHCYGTSVEGWLVLVCREHRTALAELTDREAATLGPLLKQASAALGACLDATKTYAVQFAEHPQHPHVHVHVIPRAADLPEDARGPRIFDRLGVPDGEAVTEERMNEVASLIADYFDGAPVRR